MNATIETTAENGTVNYPLDAFGRYTLERLAKWGKFVGIVNIITGIVYTLTILVFLIPTAVIGVLTIIMGTRLNNAANQLNYTIYANDSTSFSIALDQLRSSIMINGIIQILTIAGIILMVILLSIFGMVITDYF
ncbi:MAG: DUF5362 family protein [Fidelibacterota bacterium]